MPPPQPGRRHQPSFAHNGEHFDNLKNNRHGVKPKRRKRTTSVHPHERGNANGNARDGHVQAKPDFGNHNRNNSTRSTSTSTKQRHGPQHARSGTPFDANGDGNWPTLTNLSRRDVISHFHTLRKQIAAVDRDPSLPNAAARDARRRVLHARLSVVGGLAGYQLASMEGEAEHGQFDTSKWVLEHLATAIAERTVVVEAIRILDVGSIVHRFPDTLTVPASTTQHGKDEGGNLIQLDVTSIDLRAAEDADRVVKADLIDYAREYAVDAPQQLGDARGRELDDVDVDGYVQDQQQQQRHGKVFDVVCLSLCVNFEGCPFRRGDMLLAASHLVCQPDGLVFIALPRPCIDNSRYLDEDRMTAVLHALGLHLTSVRRSAKLWLGVAIRTAKTYMMTSVAKKGDGDEQKQPHVADLNKKMVVRTGATRNNFAILLRRMKRNLAQHAWQKTDGDEGNGDSVNDVEEESGDKVDDGHDHEDDQEDENLADDDDGRKVTKEESRLSIQHDLNRGIWEGGAQRKQQMWETQCLSNSSSGKKQGKGTAGSAPSGSGVQKVRLTSNQRKRARKKRARLNAPGKPNPPKKYNSL